MICTSTSAAAVFRFLIGAHIKVKVKDCVWLQAAILDHEDEGQVYFIRSPLDGVRFEFACADIVDIIETGAEIKNFDETYEVRLFVRKNALVMRVSFHLAAHLPEYLEELQFEATFKEAMTSGDYEILGSSRSASVFGELHPRPSPTPSPAPERPRIKPPVVNVRG